MPLLVRPAALADADAVARLAAEFVAYLSGLGDSAPRGITADEYRRDGFGEHAAFAGLVADDGGQIVGYLLYHDGYDVDRGGRVLHVVDLFVTDSSRGRGAGRALMEAVREVCRRRSGRALLWTVYNRNIEARTFYERLGATCAEDLLMSWRA